MDVKKITDLIKTHAQCAERGWSCNLPSELSTHLGARAFWPENLETTIAVATIIKRQQSATLHSEIHPYPSLTNDLLEVFTPEPVVALRKALEGTALSGDLYVAANALHAAGVRA